VAPDIRYLQVIVVFSLISSYELGPGPISWFIAAELFDQPSRPVAMAFASMLNWGGKFVLAFVYPPLQVCTALFFLAFIVPSVIHNLWMKASFSPATLSSSSWEIPRRSQARRDI